jgi:outer membrane protein OmpA-like peptidoglycan-associated protein
MGRLKRVLLVMDTCRAAAAIASAVVGAVTLVAAADPTPKIPLCPGLTIVTAVNQVDGDYESIKTIEAISDTAVRIKYSVERQVIDLLLNGPPKLEKSTLYRTVRRVDLQSAYLYEQQFSTELPESIPETTAIGTSSAVLDALKTKGDAKFGIFIAYTQIKPPIDRNVHPNVYDNQMVATITRTATPPAPLAVIVNDVAMKLPAIQATGDFFGDKSEFFFLDDRDNPMTLMFRIGIGAIRPLTPEARTNCERARAARVPAAQIAGMGCDRPDGADRDVLRVIKINYRCAAPVTTAAAGGAGSGAVSGGGRDAQPASANAIERALTQTGKIDIYSIYFSFNSDVIRDESESTLKDIADVLSRHADWRLNVNGHTDGTGTDQFNLDLSKRRAAAVKDALVKRYRIDPGRLVTSGFGKSQPKDSNDTLEGRAHNRRVELARIG